jgi:hypothetical protein
MAAGRTLLIAVLGILVNGAISQVRAEDPFASPRGNIPASASTMTKSAKLALPFALDTLPKSWQESILKVMQQPNLTAIAPIEEFHASAQMYQWLLDHPERTTLAWKRLQIAAIDIKALGGGRFMWQDDEGSELLWRSVGANGDGRIWYAEGKVRPGTLLPTIPVRAVAVLQHRMKKDTRGEVTIRHQVEVYLQTDSRCAALVTRMVGPAAPKMAEQGAEQLLMFFSGIARYTERHPDKVQDLFVDEKNQVKP